MIEEYLRFRAGFAEAMDPAFHGIEELDAKITGGALFWSRDDAAIVAEVRQEGASRVIHGLCATGNMETIVNELIPEAEEWGKRAGCRFAVIDSRPGWERALKASGYEVHSVAVRKEL